ncbi:hypothetical protein ACH5RR_032259 [Cinchona calisaya]|uniref:CCHC-type domain-containing protein n=1 Tax=Cinchona calisaya TaxID=153742 RepID=A0ABD2YHK2_9GENT
MDPTVVKAQLQDVERLEKCNGLNYKQWSMKIFNQLTITKVAYVLSEAYPQDEREQSNDEISANQKKWLEDDYVSRFMILNAMSNSLFNVFHTHVTTNSLWNALQRRYLNEDAGNKSFIVNKYVDFKIDDSKSIIDQINEMNDIVTQCADVGEPISEAFQVSTIIGKLPPSWKDYQKVLKHKEKPLNLDQLLQHIQIENEAELRDGLDNHGKNDIHTVEASSSKGFKSKKKKCSLNEKKNVDQKPKGNDFKKKRGPCFVCGKMGHLARDCRHRKGKKYDEANVLDDDDMIAMLTEVLMVDTDEECLGGVIEWFVDTPDKSTFASIEVRGRFLRIIR